MAYITQRPEEEKQLGLGAPGGFAGGGGQGIAGAPQAGVQKGTGGSQPWVNIQNYLRANPNDVSASNVLREDLQNPLEKSVSEVKSAGALKSDELGRAKQSADASILSSDQELMSAKNALKDSIVKNKDFNVYGSAINRANDLASAKFNTPEFTPSYLNPSLKASFDKISDPYALVSQGYQSRGLTGGQRALQDQLSRKSSINVPEIARALGTQYNQAVSDVSKQNADISSDIGNSEEKYRNALVDAKRKVNSYQADQTSLQNAINDPNEWGRMYWGSTDPSRPTKSNVYGNLGGAVPKSFLDYGKAIDAWDKSYVAQQNPSVQKGYKYGTGADSEYSKALAALMSKYGFG